MNETLTKISFDPIYDHTEEKQEVAPNANVKSFQNSFHLFGISYSGRTDGIVDFNFALTMRQLEKLIHDKTGENIKIFTSGTVNMSASDVLNKFFPKPSKIVNPVAPVAPVDTVAPDGVDQNVAFKNLLSENLPVVGKLFNGGGAQELATAAKTLETVIGKEIGKSIVGVIWNDKQHIFNTNVDDIRRALDLIDQHKKVSQKISSRLDDRFLKMSKILSEK